jgi:hypothetical protein
MKCRDYKHEMQLIAEDLAQSKYSREFSDLSADTQFRLFRRAEEAWSEGRMAEAEALADRLNDR